MLNYLSGSYANAYVGNPHLPFSAQQERHECRHKRAHDGTWATWSIWTCSQVCRHLLRDRSRRSDRWKWYLSLHRSPDDLLTSGGIRASLQPYAVKCGLAAASPNRNNVL